ncbi:mas-related G-protein coupled receptor member H-like isoform X2 [Paroedura picta]|uniref:mas-related G-protein coupled receptor member H-like isoform X2 n=1 Tax=Paroedura picta TaxID=143630 RepID=UPI0040577B7B
MGAVLDNFNSTNYTYPSSTGSKTDNTSVVSYNRRNLTEYVADFQEIYNFTSRTSLIVLAISILGTVGNGIVIWLLGFRIKRNPFMTFILNLAVADIWVLLSFNGLILEQVMGINDIFYIIFITLHLLMYSASQYLLTAISIDRCVAVSFPIWHRCKRPLHLSTIVCAVLWVLSVLLTAITWTLLLISWYGAIPVYLQLILNVVVCLPAMTAATVSLFIKVCLKARHPRRGRLLTIVLLTLLFFLLFAFPGNVLYLLNFHNNFIASGNYSAALLVCLNSSVNPVIYFLLGRQWKSRRRESMKMILQKAFKEEEGCAEETTAEI